MTRQGGTQRQRTPHNESLPTNDAAAREPGSPQAPAGPRRGAALPQGQWRRPWLRHARAHRLHGIRRTGAGADPSASQASRALPRLLLECPRGKRRRDQAAGVHHDTAEDTQTAPPAATAAVRKRWADLLRRVYEVDPLVCPRCAGNMHVVGFVTHPEAIKRILDRLRCPSQPRPRPPPAHTPQRPSASL